MNIAILVAVVAICLLAQLGPLGLVAGGFIGGFLAGGPVRGSWVGALGGSAAASLALLYTSPWGRMLDSQSTAIAQQLFGNLVRPEASSLTFWLTYVVYSGVGGAGGGLLRPRYI